VALIAATDISQPALPGAAKADDERDGTRFLCTRGLPALGVPPPVSGTGGVAWELDGEAPWRPALAARLPERGSTDLTPAAVSLPSRSGSNPDLLDAAGRSSGCRRVLRRPGHKPATFVRVSSGSHADVSHPGDMHGTSRRTTIPLFVRSC
jgi:hypothetical protein